MTQTTVRGTTQKPTVRPNLLGRIALVIAVIGIILGFIPGLLIYCWPVLLAALILGIIGTLLRGRKKTVSVIAIILAVLGSAVPIIVIIAASAGS